MECVGFAKGFSEHTYPTIKVKAGFVVPVF